MKDVIKSATNDVVLTPVKSATKAQQVLVSSKNMEKLHTYHELCGVQMTFVVNRAIEEWFESVGDVRMDVLTNHSRVQPN